MGDREYRAANLLEDAAWLAELPKLREVTLEEEPDDEEREELEAQLPDVSISSEWG